MTVAAVPTEPAALIEVASERGPVHHFAVLDGLRGVAAYCVFLVHSFNREWATNGFLGVDFFFLLSGFVIAYSYGGRLASGRITLREFARRRFIRLYPMIVAGSLLGLAILVLHNRANPADRYGTGLLAAWTVFSLLMLPWLRSNRSENAIFPLNTVLWSLFFELVANAVYAVWARRMTIPVLASIAAAGLVLTCGGAELDGGKVSTFWTGFPRVAFGFFAGALVYELRAAGRLPRWSAGLLPLSLVLVAITFYPRQIAGVAFAPVGALFCLVVLLGANARVGPGVARLCRLLAEISYPMYLIHRPVLYLVVGVAKKFAVPQGPGYVAMVVAAMAIATILSLVIARVYEHPAVRLLGRATSRAGS